MNNVLALANSGKTSQDIVWRTSSFDSMFLNGFWKKMVFLLDADSSLQLTYATKDFASFRLSYLVHKLGITDPKVIKEAASSDTAFGTLVKKQKLSGKDSTG